jgi:hypothetical protein
MVDQFGRIIDADHDGIDDPRDKCPDTPADLVVDASGCPQIPKMPQDSRGLSEASFNVNAAVFDMADSSSLKCMGRNRGWKPLPQIKGLHDLQNNTVG